MKDYTRVRLRRSLNDSTLTEGTVGEISMELGEDEYLVDFSGLDETLKWPDDFETVSGRYELLRSLGVDEDELLGTAAERRQIRTNRYSGFDPGKIQRFSPLVVSLLDASDPLAEFERLAQALSGCGELFNLLGALIRLEDPRVREIADRALATVERDLAVSLLESVPDTQGTNGKAYLAEALRLFDAAPRGDVIARAGDAYTACKIAQCTEGIDPVLHVAAYQEARQKALDYVRWRRELKNRSDSEFQPTSEAAEDLATESHLLPACAIALVAILYRKEDTVPDHYFWTYYASLSQHPSHQGIDAAALFFNELRPSQTQEMIRRLMYAEREARPNLALSIEGKEFPPGLDRLRVIPAVAAHFQHVRQ